jgi:hypothetical protein
MPFENLKFEDGVKIITARKKAEIMVTTMRTLNLTQYKVIADMSLKLNMNMVNFFMVM